jgi:predicted porin
MKKQVLSAAVAAAMALPVSSAFALDGAKGSSVQIYGRFQAELTNVDGDLQDPRYMSDVAPGRFGFFATEKLGDNLTAFGRFEYSTDTTNNTGVGGRDSYIGVKGDWGLFLAGKHASPYKITGGVKADPFVGTTMEARKGGGMSSGAFGHTSFAPHVLAYASPNWGGFSFIAAYNPENSDGAQATLGDGDISGFYSLGAQYKNGPIWLWAGYSDQKDQETTTTIAGTTQGDSRKRWKLGAAFDFGNSSIRAQYEEADGYGERLASNSILGASGLSAEGTGKDGTFYWAAYVYKAGNNTIMASWGREDFDDNAAAGLDDQKWDIYTLAAKHNFSKTFSGWVGVKYYKIDDLNDVDPDADKVTGVSIGMRKDWKI